MVINIYVLRTIAGLAAWVAGFNWYRFTQGRPVPYIAAAITAAIALYDRNMYAIPTYLLCAYHATRIRCIGLTGSIATGKSSVSRRFSELGAYVVDADQVARDVVEPGTSAFRKIVQHFGPRILDDNGLLDRAALREIIANDAEERRFLNSVTHPAIALEIFKRVAWNRWVLGQKVVIDAALLYESGLFLQLLCTPIIVVTCPPAAQIQRLLTRDGGERDAAEKLISAQAPQAEKAVKADIVIRNDGTLNELMATVDALWGTIFGRQAVERQY